MARSAESVAREVERKAKYNRNKRIAKQFGRVTGGGAPSRNAPPPAASDTKGR